MVVLGISAMLIVLQHHIRVQQCFVSIMLLRILGYILNLEELIFGLVILTCYHMEEGKVPSSMAGSQDALLPTPIGILVNQTIGLTMKIMQKCIHILANGLMKVMNRPFSNTLLNVAVSTNLPLQQPHPPDLQLIHHLALHFLHHLVLQLFHHQVSQLPNHLHHQVLHHLLPRPIPSDLL